MTKKKLIEYKKYPINQKIKNMIYDNQNILSYNTRHSQPYQLNHHLSDVDGLDKAYDSDNKIFIDGDKMYIAGTQPSPIGDNFMNTLKNTRNWIQDWKDDITLIPFHLTQLSERYKTAQDELLKNPEVDTLIGHSLGAGVSLELNKNYGNKFKTRVYSAPVFDLFKNNSVNEQNERFRTLGDPVSLLDNNAITITKNTLNPIELHSYKNFSNINSKTIK